MKTPAEFLSKKGLSHRYPIIGGKYDSNLLNLLIEFNEYQGFEQLESRIKELEQTIENMKAIAGEKIEPVGCVSSVDYPNEGETEVYVFVPVEINYWKGKSTHIYRKSFKTIEECQDFFDNIHKKDSGERWDTMLCDYKGAKWETKENGDLFMSVDHDGANVEYICMKLGVK